MKKTDNKGFTLIEIVIVIVIIAILAAILVPSLLTWIDKSKEKALVSSADTVRQSVTTEIVEYYKDGKKINGEQTSEVYDSEFWDKASDLAGTKLQCTDSKKAGYVTFTIVKNSMTEFSYSDGTRTAVYDSNNSTWDVKDTAK
jgi:prepilin-type N-terminal cleavage/methylation domain-containing protein